MKQTPLIPICTNTNKYTGVDELCMTPGNSAWTEAEEQMVTLEEGFVGHYFFFDKGTGSEGYVTDGRLANAKAISSEINFPNDGSFRNLGTGFPSNYFAAEWTGLVHIKEAGKYKFSTASDDGSKAWIMGDLVVDNWGLHGKRRREGEIDLATGYYPVKVTFFENAGAANMEFKYSGPDTGDKEEFVKGWHQIGE